MAIKSSTAKSEPIKRRMQPISDFRCLTGCASAASEEAKPTSESAACAC
jgi:hypothetical protein